MVDRSEKKDVCSAEGFDKVVGKVNLQDILMVGCDASRTLEEPPEDYIIQEKSGVEVLETKPVSKNFRALWIFGLRAVTKKDGEIDQELFRVEAQYMLTYELKDRKKIKMNDVQSFVEINSIIHVWPFWREFVHTQTSRMGVPVVTVGVKPPRKGLVELIRREKGEIESPKELPAE